MKRIQLNLATIQYYEKKTIYPILAAAVILVLILSLFNVHRYSRYRSQVGEIEDRILHLERTGPVRYQAAKVSLPVLSEKDLSTLREQVGFVNRLIAMDVFPWDRLLDEIESCTPPNILIQRFAATKERERVRIEGKAGSMMDITEFLESLESSSLFRNSTLLSVATPRDGGETATSKMSSAIRFEIEASAAVEPIAEGSGETAPESTGGSSRPEKNGKDFTTKG
jgi:hypothetical protein